MSLPGPEPPLSWRLLLAAALCALVSAGAAILAFWAWYALIAGR